MHATLPLLAATDFPPIRRRRLDTLQVNVGYVCNQTCLHCHVNAGPTRTEAMTAQTAAKVLEYFTACGATTADLTRGGPELHASFRGRLRAGRPGAGKGTARCTPARLFAPGAEHLARG